MNEELSKILKQTFIFMHEVKLLLVKLCDKIETISWEQEAFLLQRMY